MNNDLVKNVEGTEISPAAAGPPLKKIPLMSTIIDSISDEEIRNSFEAFSKEEKTIDIQSVAHALDALGLGSVDEKRLLDLVWLASTCEAPKMKNVKLDRTPLNEKVSVIRDEDVPPRLRLDQFARLCASTASLTAPNALRGLFKLFDEKNRGYVTIADLRRVVVELKDTMSNEELQEMIEEADSNNDGRVTEDDFVRIMAESGAKKAKKSGKKAKKAEAADTDEAATEAPAAKKTKRSAKQ